MARLVAMQTVTPIIVHVVNSGTDWASVAAAAATFLAAALGIGGTAWVAKRARAAASADLAANLRASTDNLRLGIDTDLEHARHAHKRQVYGSFVGALTMFIGEVVKTRTALQGGRPGETPLDRRAKLDAAADTLGMVLGDLILAAPPTVRRAAEEAAQFAYDVLAAPPPATPPQAVVRMPQGYMDLANNLVALMQADLGELPDITAASPLP